MERKQLTSYEQSFVLNKFISCVVVNIGVSCTLLFLITKQKSIYLPLCYLFPFKNRLDASANYNSNLKFSNTGFERMYVVKVSYCTWPFSYNLVAFSHVFRATRPTTLPKKTSKPACVPLGTGNIVQNISWCTFYLQSTRMACFPFYSAKS